jgi:hypothetical protein
MPGVTVRGTGDTTTISVAATRRLPTGPACGGAGGDRRCREGPGPEGGAGPRGAVGPGG